MYSIGTEILNVFRPSAFWSDGVDQSITSWKSVGWLNGNFLMVRREVIQAVGGLDERFYTFQCEADWCLRIRRAGWKVAYVPDVKVMHIGGTLSGPGAIRVKTHRNLIRAHVNRYYFIRKHYGNRAVNVFRLIMSTGATLRLLKYGAVWLVSPNRRAEAWPKVTAYWNIVLLGAAPHPEGLPEELRRENGEYNLFSMDVTR
jgi:GT2 family glycosyltransferase